MLNQNVLATIISVSKQPIKLIISSMVCNYQFIYYSSPLSKTTRKQRLFLSACANNKTDVVKLLLHYIIPSHEENKAIILAAKNNHPEVVKLLLGDKRVNPADRNNAAIRWASENGHLEVVKLLLGDEKTNPADMNNIAIFYSEL